MRRFLVCVGSGLGLAFLLTGLGDLLFHLNRHGSAEQWTFLVLTVAFTLSAVSAGIGSHPPK